MRAKECGRPGREKTNMQKKSAKESDKHRQRDNRK